MARRSFQLEEKMTLPNLNTFAPGMRGHPFTLPQVEKGSRIIVAGAGSFGVWTSLFLLKRGFTVTLFDASGPANPHSSSGDQTRVIRSTYGGNRAYFDLNVRALAHWRDLERTTGRSGSVFRNTGVLWLCHEEKTPLVDESIPFARHHKMEYVYLSRKELAGSYPAISGAGLHHAYLDPYGGYLYSAEAVRLVFDQFMRHGGEYIGHPARPGDIKNNQLQGVRTPNGKIHTADLYIFACGAWLRTLFPELLGHIITCTRQEVYYFEVAEAIKSMHRLPVWVDVDGVDFYYGIPQDDGFKIGVDRRGENFDPDSDDRSVNPAVLDHARAFLSRRFPLMKGARLIRNRVCPYESSPDGNFVFDAHPGASNLLVLGGGSGHGFKHGPALGELVASVLSGEKNPPAIFSLNRFG